MSATEYHVRFAESMRTLESLGESNGRGEGRS
jgi:hypothetical protein